VCDVCVLYPLHLTAAVISLQVEVYFLSLYIYLRDPFPVAGEFQLYRSVSAYGFVFYYLY